MGFDSRFKGAVHESYLCMGAESNSLMDGFLCELQVQFSEEEGLFLKDL